MYGKYIVSYIIKGSTLCIASDRIGAVIAKVFYIDIVSLSPGRVKWQTIKCLLASTCSVYYKIW